MPFTTTVTTPTSIDDSVITLWDEGIILGSVPEMVATQLATVEKRNIPGKSETFTLYAAMAAATTTLTIDEDVTSVEVLDTGVTLTPIEKGIPVTKTKLASLQSAGKIDRAIPLLVGTNMGRSVDKLAVTALEAFTTLVIYPNSVTAASGLSTADNLNNLFANRLYNKLSRTNTPSIGGNYFGIAHEDCLFDLRGDMVPVKQYQDLTSIMQNEVGMAFGIRWLKSGNVTVTADSAGTVDSYKVEVVGFNAFGYCSSEDPHGTITGPYDKLSRFTNIGWYGCFVYGTIDTANMVQGICASSVGAN